MRFRPSLLIAAAAAAMALQTGAASAAYTISNDGTVSNANAASFATALTDAAITGSSASGVTFATGQNGAGWDPYGTADSTHNWVSLSGGAVTFSYTAAQSALSFIWGSPSSGNQVQLYSGANGTGTLLGTFTTDSLGAVANSQNDPAGYLISIATGSSGEAFKSAVFTGVSQAFEIGGVKGVSAVPIPAALPLFGTAIVGFGVYARRRGRKTNAV